MPRPNTWLIWKLQNIIGCSSYGINDLNLDMSPRCLHQGRSWTSEKVADFVTCIGIFQDFAVLKPLKELVWPEMPFAPPESDYGDNETMEHPGQFRREQFRDTSVCPSGASGSSSQAGQMAGYVCGDTPT